MSNIEEQVEDISARLPIEFPEQVYVRKSNKYIASYDPVFSIGIKDGELYIEGVRHLYTHKLDEFDRVYVTTDEPVELEDKL